MIKKMILNNKIMFDFLCECLSNNLVHPSVAQILETLNRHTVCTGTQCFEQLQDFIPMHTPPANNEIVSMQTLSLIAVLCVLAWTRPQNINLQGKPVHVNVNRLHED